MPRSAATIHPDTYGPDTDVDGNGGIAMLYARYWRELCQFIRVRYGAGPPDPEDVAQIAFLRYAQMPAHAEVRNARALLYRTAINVVIDHKRQEKVAATTPAADLPDHEVDVAAPGLGPEGIVLHREELAVLEEVVRNLPPRHRSFFLANRLENLSYAEIARRTGVSQSGVRKIVEEALAVCQAALKDRKNVDYRGLSRERAAKR